MISNLRKESTALIVGAGIGGLAAAVALQKAGWAVRVFERAPVAREVGFALLLAPNAMRALRELGVGDEIAARGVAAQTGELRRPDGTVLRRLDLRPFVEQFGVETVAALRPMVHGALLKAAGDVVQLGSRAVSFRQARGEVELALADGKTAVGRVLIGADGVASAIRSQLHPGEAPPRSSDIVGIRGLARGAARHVGADGAQYFGRGCEVGMARVSAEDLYWYVSAPVDPQVDLALPPASLALRLTRSFHESVRAIVAATSADDLRMDLLLDRDPVGRWGEGAVTLLGDAAHPMLPHAGQGAAQALEDAIVLGRALAAGGPPEDALSHYEKERTRRTASFVSLSRSNARMGSIRNAALCWLRDTIIRAVPERWILKRLIALSRTPWS